MEFFYLTQVDTLRAEFGDNTPACVVAAIRAALSLAKYNRNGTAADNTIGRIAKPLGVATTTVKKRNFRDEIYDCPRYVAANGTMCDAYAGDVID